MRGIEQRVYLLHIVVLREGDVLEVRVRVTATARVELVSTH